MLKYHKVCDENHLAIFLFIFSWHVRWTEIVVGMILVDYAFDN